MKTPKHLVVLGQKYSLNRTVGLQESGILGFCNQRDKSINIDASLKGDEFWRTLIHEVGHALEAEGSIHQAVPQEVFEIITDLFGRVLADNLKISFK